MPEDANGDQSGRIGTDDLARRFREVFADRRFVVVSNREPYEHRWGEDVGEVEVRRPAGGLTSALDPVLQAVGGVWIAWGSGEADAVTVDEHGRIRVPPESPSYTLRRIWLDQYDIHRYYLGFSNQFLWPLCHLRPALTRVRERYWTRYRRVNRRFADAVLDETRGVSAAVWFQDYHLALAPLYVRERRSDLTLAHFWHIPWPPLEIFRVTPQGRDLLEGLLANDLLGFHLQSFVNNFLHCAQEVLGADVDFGAGTATQDGHTCHVGAFPISIDVDAFRGSASRDGAEELVARIRERYGAGASDRILGLGVDRLDYSKGLPEKLKALDILWEWYPELRERLTFVQVAVPSRTDIEAYDELNQKVERQVWELNDRFGTADWRPVHLIKQALPPDRLAILYRASDICIVGSLQDGMNLVAKEYVASQVDGRGALLLSRFTGAVEELEGCIEVNPYDPEDFAQRIRDAATMSEEERGSRMRRMQASMRTIFDWMDEIFVRWGAVHARRPESATRAPEAGDRLPPAPDDRTGHRFTDGGGHAGAPSADPVAARAEEARAATPARSRGSESETPAEHRVSGT